MEPWYEQLKRERNAHLMTQQEVAEKVGTDARTVRTWESGRSVPTMYFRRKLCDLYEKKPEELGLDEEAMELFRTQKNGFITTGEPIAKNEVPLSTHNADVASAVTPDVHIAKENRYVPETDSRKHPPALSKLHVPLWRVGGVVLIIVLIITVISWSWNRGPAGYGKKPKTVSAGLIREFPIPTENSNTTSITRGADGNLWFTEKTGNKIGRITPQGRISEFLIPTPNSISTEITRGADGNLWFFENRGNKIGRITPQGRISEFLVPSGSNLVGITAGPDDNLWFTEFDRNRIGRITTSGVITGEFTIPTPNSGTETISAGPDGNLWFVEDWSNKIGRITPQGIITEFPIPTPLVPGQQNYHDLTAGPDGNLWFTEGLAHKIGRITPQGIITEFPVPLPGDYLGSLCSGPDGNLWFTDSANHIARMTTSGTFTDFFIIPTPDSEPAAITAGPDKNLWFTEYNGNKIGEITTGNSETSSSVPALVQKNFQNQHANSITVTFPSDVTAGNLILVAITQYKGMVSSVTDNHDNVYAQVVATERANTSADFVQLYYAKNVAGGATTVTVPFSVAGDKNVGIYEYSGLDTTSPLDQGASNAGIGDTPDGGALNTTMDNELYFVVGVDDSGNNSAPSAGSGYTLEDHQDDSVTHERFYSEDRISASGNYQTNFSIAVGSHWAVICASFKPAETSTHASSISADLILPVLCGLRKSRPISSFYTEQ